MLESRNCYMNEHVEKAKKVIVKDDNSKVIKVFTKKDEKPGGYKGSIEFQAQEYVRNVLHKDYVFLNISVVR